MNELFLAIEINCTVMYKVVDAKSLTDHRFNLAGMKTDSGIIIVAEDIFTIDKIFFPLSRYLTKIRRQKIILMVTNTTNTDFDAQASDILVKFFQRIQNINVVLITPCSNGRKVCNLRCWFCMCSQGKFTKKCDFFFSFKSQTILTYFPLTLNSVGNTTVWGVSKSIPIRDFRLSDIDLFVKFRNFNGYPLRISFFRRYPTSIYLNELSQAVQNSRILKDSWRVANFTGIDGFMLSSFVEKFNFTPILSKPREGDFGYRDQDGRFLGNVLRKWHLNKKNYALKRQCECICRNDWRHIEWKNTNLAHRPFSHGLWHEWIGIFGTIFLWQIVYSCTKSTENTRMDGHFSMLWQICVAGAACNELHMFVVLDYAQTSSSPVRKSYGFPLTF